MSRHPKRLHPAGQGVLADHDPVAAPADADLIATAIRYAHSNNGNDETLLSWARYASHAARTLWGPTHPTTLRINSIYQNVLGRQGLTFEAVTVCAQRLHAYQQLGQPGPVLWTRLSLAKALHQDGQCDQARYEIATLWRTWCRATHSPFQGRAITVSHAVIMAGCGRTRRAENILRHRAHLLPAHGDSEQLLMANTLSTTETLHPAVCQRHPDPVLPDRRTDRREFWQTVLEQVAPARTAGTAATCDTTPYGPAYIAAVPRHPEPTTRPRPGNRDTR